MDINFSIHPLKQKLTQLQTIFQKTFQKYDEEVQGQAQAQAHPDLSQIIEIKNLLIYLDALKKSGLERAIPNISEQTACVILQLLQAKKAKNILEIGCANGYSSLYWAAYCKYLAPEFNIEEDTTKNIKANIKANLTSIDISAPMVKEAMDHLLKQKLHLQTQIYWADALAVLPRLGVEQFDAIFIDAQKSKTLEILELTLPLMQKNALLVIDDVIKFAEKMGALFEFLKIKNINYQIIKTDEDDGILWAIF